LDLSSRAAVGWVMAAAKLKTEFMMCDYKRGWGKRGLLSGLALFAAATAFAAGGAGGGGAFPPPLESYGDVEVTGLLEVLKHRVSVEPFNLWATVLFLLAVIHTFLTHQFRHLAHVLEDRHKSRLAQAGQDPQAKTCMSARLLHFLGEVEAVFGIWVVPLLGLMALKIGVQPTLDYVNQRVSYHEPLFVVVIMAIASTRPILNLAEQCLRVVARLGGGGPAAWWLSILTLGPVLGSLITEPAAMTISALLLARQFYALKPPAKFAYATLGLLFVNVSVGGVLTHFAAPPVLMVAKPWGWNTPYMFTHFGVEALVGIAVSNALYFFCFRRQFKQLAAVPAGAANAGPPVPVGVTIGHLLFMAWSVLNAHHPALLIGGFLFFLAYYEVTADYQTELQLRSPILVGFFLAGLVIHGGLQSWWIAPVLGRLGEVPLMLGATVLTAFNDNAAITYLATLVPGLTDGLKHAVVAGAITGGGLTVIANAPNPAGQAILGRFFPDGVSPLRLLLGALPPTVVMALCFLLMR
jgi:hypothetical protein